MKNVLVLGWLVCAACVVSGAETPVVDASARTSRNFNFGWKFAYGPRTDAARVDFDDAAWTTVDLPHDYQIHVPWSKSASKLRGFKPQCEGWYRKTFAADPSWRNQRVLLDFEGILAWGDVYLNGERVGGCDMGYLGFEVDIGDKLRYDRPNVVAVWSTTGADRISRWYTGGGLYRNVWLVTEPRRGFARHGLFVRTPRVSATSAEVCVGAELTGFTGETNAVIIRAEIRDPQGSVVGRSEGRLADYNQVHPEVLLAPCVVTKPRLWSPAAPCLYTIDAEVVFGGATVARRSARFGIRDITFSPDFGLKINGVKTIVKGVANHHDLGILGAAAYPRAERRYIETLKRFGVNAIRTSHNPYSESFLEACDELGMLVIDEWTDKWTSSGWHMCSRVPFLQLFPTSVPEWIRRDRNHPSVILWSLGNELQQRACNSGLETDDWGVTTYRMLDVLVKRYDPTRKTTVAQFPVARDVQDYKDPRNQPENDPLPSALLAATEVASQNYIPERYAGFKRHCPHLILFQSEARTSDLLGSVLAMDLATSVGFAYWGVVEYWGESRGWPAKGWSSCSWFARDLEPYPQAWLVKSYFQPDEPVAKIGVEVSPEVSEVWNAVKVGLAVVRAAWNFKTDTPTIPCVHVYSNGETAELFVNGKSLGEKRVGTYDKKREANTATWRDVPYGKGGELLAIARRGGREIARDRLVTTGRAVALRIEAENVGDWRADGSDLLYLHVRAIDAEGRVVPNASDEVRVDVCGAGRLLATDDGNQRTAYLPVDNPKRLYQGRQLIVIRAGIEPGKTSVTLTSPTLRSVSAEFTSR